ncbi:hypothetical protein NMY22_g12716 [Coprinellus aureogranulatus]|nr:hypothetical protein NMY22_g12716 [Coprinellus aureogranulatus]
MMSCYNRDDYGPSSSPGSSPALTPADSSPFSSPSLEALQLDEDVDELPASRDPFAGSYKPRRPKTREN